MDKKYDVIVIGAGISGLSSAKLLHESGLDVVVLEARDRVGGRTHTLKNDNVGYVDLGGSYVGPTQDRVLRMCKEFGLETYLVYDETDAIIYTKGKPLRSQGSFPSYWNPFVKLDLNNVMRTMDKYGSEIPLDAPWKAPRAKEWDQKTMKDFFNETIWTRPVRHYADQFVRLCVASEPYEVSMLWFLWHVAQCGGTNTIYAITNGGQERKIKGGSQQISNCMAAKLGEHMVLNSPVSQVIQTSSGVKVITAFGSTYEGKFVVIAVPPSLRQKMIYDPPLPPEMNQLVQRAPAASAIKTIAYYKRAFWREKGYSGLTLTTDQSEAAGATIDDTKPDGSKPAVMGFILADNARQMVSMTMAERKSAVCQGYARVFQTNEAMQPVHYEEKNWSAEQWSGGCYAAFLSPGFLTLFGSKLREPCGRLFWAGSETATKWSGYMDGAIQAGERAAREILCVMGKISKHQIWQTEPESQDVRQKPWDLSFWDRHSPRVSTALWFLSFLGIGAAATIINYILGWKNFF